MRPRILIIDDEPEIRELYRNFLESEDYDIMEAQDGQEAFRLASEIRFDLFITDIMMPKMNGVEFMKVLKMIDPDAVVIIVTGFDDMEFTKEALNYGAFRFLTKPINMKEFLSIVEMGLVERKQLFQNSTSETLFRLKDKLISNPDLQQKVFEKLEDLLLSMESQNISQLEMGGHGSKGRIWARVRGELKPVSGDRSFNQDEINIMILSILGKTELESLLDNKYLKFNHEFVRDDVRYRYRAKVFFDLSELVVTIKPTRRDILPLEGQNITKPFIQHATIKSENSGIVLFTGPAASGKSSLIDALVDYNNNNAHGSIYIIADSLEFYHDSKGCVVRQQEIHSDVNNLAEALKSTLDFNPDLVVIEDIRYTDVLMTLMKLVDTGSLVFATLRTRSAIEAITKLIHMFNPTEQEQARSLLANNLNAIISQQLLTAKNGQLVLAKEILFNTPQVANAITNGNFNEIYPLIMQGVSNGVKVGMNTLEQDLLNLAKRGIITKEVALEHANNVGQLDEMFKYR
ncbi:MAG: Flp pilus assembly complex ATPase component TadA [Candidatus Cloacimonetes bacterium]|nr:Flp pilus assembly complex ATPase component TadA [Candidatus Cloacimonadota bacterium]